MIVGTAAAVVRDAKLRVSDLATLRHLVEFFGQQLEIGFTPLIAAQIRDHPEDVVEDMVDAIGVGAIGVAVDFH